MSRENYYYSRNEPKDQATFTLKPQEASWVNVKSKESYRPTRELYCPKKANPQAVRVWQDSDLGLTCPQGVGVL